MKCTDVVLPAQQAVLPQKDSKKNEIQAKSLLVKFAQRIFKNSSSETTNSALPAVKPFNISEAKNENSMHPLSEGVPPDSLEEEMINLNENIEAPIIANTSALIMRRIVRICFAAAACFGTYYLLSGEAVRPRPDDHLYRTALRNNQPPAPPPPPPGPHTAQYSDLTTLLRNKDGAHLKQELNQLCQNTLNTFCLPEHPEICLRDYLIPGILEKTQISIEHYAGSDDILCDAFIEVEDCSAITHRSLDIARAPKNKFRVNYEEPSASLPPLSLEDLAYLRSHQIGHEASENQIKFKTHVFCSEKV
jgi:hypothetical protein